MDSNVLVNVLQNREIDLCEKSSISKVFFIIQLQYNLDVVVDFALTQGFVEALAER